MSDVAPVLRLDAAVWPASAAHRAAGPVSLTLAPGETALVEAADPDWMTALGDLVCGLVEPAAGGVWFEGRPWTGDSPGAQAARRARIGRVFHGAAWLSNLDVDENVVLASLYHSGVSRAEALKEADALARRFGVDGLPRGRPAWIDLHALQPAQWVRAWLRRPALLVLEEPLRHAEDRLAPRVHTAVRDAAAAGAAVVWMTERPGPELAGALNPAVRIALTEARAGGA